MKARKNIETVRRTGGLFCAIGAMLIAGTLFTTEADAGTYQPRLCSTSNSSEGFTHSAAHYSDLCYSSGILIARAESDPGSTGSWTLTAPADTTLTGYSVAHRYIFGSDSSVLGKGVVGIYPSGGAGWWWTSCFVVSCTSGYDSGWTTQQMAAGWFSASSIEFRAYCYNETVSCASGGAAEYQISDIRPYISDPSDPARGSFDGGLYDKSDSLVGMENLSWTATDTGSGVYTTALLVDGEVVDSWVPDTNSGRCVEHSGFFYYTQPCKTSVLVERDLDTTTLSEGEHTFAVRETDVSGNVYTSGSWTRTVDNIASPTAPVSGKGGSVSGDVKSGEELTCSHGTFTGDDLTYTYAWLRDGSEISGATSSSYTVKSSDVGHEIICRVTATNVDGSASEDLTVPVASDATPSSYGSSSSGSGSSETLGTTSTSSSKSTTTGVVANGSGASRQTSILVTARSSKMRKSYKKSVKLQGTLLNSAGSPVVNATVVVQAKTKLVGSSFKTVGSVKTDSAGKFTYSVPRGPSREVKFSYRVFDGDQEWSDTTTVELAVEAGALLKVSRKRLRNGQLIRFTGKLLGGPFPSGRGKIIELLARDGGQWKAFGKGTVRANSNGQFKAKYRFLHTFRKATYKFKARVRAEDSYPYLAGSSNTVKVTVRP